MFCTFGLNLVTIAWTGHELSREQACDWHRDGQTDRHTKATTIPKGQNWPQVKIITTSRGQRFQPHSALHNSSLLIIYQVNPFVHSQEITITHYNPPPLFVLALMRPKHKMATFLQTIFSDAFSWMKSFVFFIKISLKFVPKGPIDNNPALVQIMAWRRIGIWTNADPIHWRIHAALGGDELNEDHIFTSMSYF